MIQMEKVSDQRDADEAPGREELAEHRLPDGDGLREQQLDAAALRSSAHRRMDTAGTRNRYSQGRKLNSEIRSAWPRSNSAPK